MKAPIGSVLFCLATPAVVAQDPMASAPSANVRYADILGQDALSYAISLQVDLAQERLVGDVNYEFAATTGLTEIRLDAKRSDEWHVRFAGTDGRELAVTWAEDQVVLHLPSPVAEGAKVQFVAHLAGKPVDGFYFANNRHGEPLAFTDHYSIRARGWLPCEDNPADRAHFSLLLTYPEDQEAIAFGRDVSALAHLDPPPTGMKKIGFAGSAAIPPYMFAVVVGPFARVQEAGDPRLVDHFVYRRDVEAARPLLTHHAQWLQTMERTFGPYPYAKYTTVQCPTRWGGFEAPGNVLLAEDVFDHPVRGTGTLAHELVHMWFGDGTGYAEWREAWLAEGFASYFGPWLHAAAGGPALEQGMRGMRDRWLQSFEGRTKTIRDDRFPHPDQALNSNTYPKGAWVLHMLRGELGDDAFFAAIAAYYAECRGRSVRTSDFVAAVARSCKQDLGWFFAQWLDRVGCPELRLGSDGGKLVVEQIQKGEPYTFWLRLRTGPGDADVHRVRIAKAREVLDVNATPEQITLDPDVELLFRPAR